MVECGPKLNDDVKEETEINDRIDDEEVGSLHNDRVKTEFERNAEGVIQRQYDDEQFPLRFPWVVLADHEGVLFVA